MADGSRVGSLRRRLTRFSSALAAALLVGGITAAGAAANTGRGGDHTTRNAMTMAAASAAPGAPLIASVAPRGTRRPGHLDAESRRRSGDQLHRFRDRQLLAVPHRLFVASSEHLASLGQRNAGGRLVSCSGLHDSAHRH